MAEKLVEIKFDQKKLNKIREMFKSYPSALPQIVTRAINKTALSARTQISRSLASKVKLKISTIRKAIKLIRATRLRWLAEISVTSRRIPLIHFGAKQTKTGVSYTIDKTSGRKNIAHAFIAAMPSGHTGVFKRRAESRLPIDERFGPSLGVVYEDTPELAAGITQKAYEDLSKNIDVQTALLLERYRRAA